MSVHSSEGVQTKVLSSDVFRYLFIQFQAATGSDVEYVLFDTPSPTDWACVRVRVATASVTTKRNIVS